MTTVQHSTLTGSSLHEPKGVAAAAANKVYVSDGAGSGAWSTVPAAALASTANSFGANLLHVRDEKTSGTDGGTFTSGAWRTRVLNTIKTNEITSASLGSNQISLPSGTYYIEADAPAKNVYAHKAKLYNVTDSSDILIGTAAFSDGGTGQYITSSKVKGRFTLAGTKTLELQHYCSSTKNTDGFGNGSTGSIPGVEVYAEVSIWKIS